MRRCLLVVSEQVEARESLAILLRSQGFTVSAAAGAADAVRVLRSGPVDTVLLVSQGPDGSGEKLRARILSERPEARVLALNRTTSLRNHVRHIRFGLGEHLLTERELVGLLSADHDPWDPQGEESAPPDKGVHSLLEVVDILVGLLELGDRHFIGSSHRAMLLARSVAEEMKLPEEIRVEISLATLLRDIGKYGTDEDLRQSGTLSDEQTLKMREHVAGGVRLLEHIEFPWKVLAIIRHHHERYDGLGYPDGLRGPEIPLGARILAVVDAYVAMLSQRPHRDPMTSEQALAELERQAGIQFDPEVVELFMRVVREHRAAALNPDQRPRVMIVDRDKDFLRLLKMRLHNEGMEVGTDTNLQDALLGMLESPPQLILADVGEDESRSFDFLKVLRQDENLARVPFAFLVPRVDLAQSVRVLRQGVDDCLVKTDDLELLVARLNNILIRETRRQGKEEAPSRRGIAGQLENMALPDIIQMLNMGLKTACVSLSRGDSAGRIWFDEGAAVHAEAGDRSGAEAVYELLRWTDGEFVIEHGVKAEKCTIESDTMFLVMEGLRRIDESSLQAAT